MRRVLRTDGNYDGRGRSLAQSPGAISARPCGAERSGTNLFLQRKYDDAVKVLQSVLAIDPEDLQAHYNLMLCYNGLGDEKMAKEHQARYLRFKADESSQTITGHTGSCIPKTTTSGSPFTSTSRCRWTGVLEDSRPSRRPVTALADRSAAVQSE